MSALALVGCSPGEEEARADLEALQERVVGEMRQAVDAVDGAGVRVQRASGAAEYCRMPPAGGVTFLAGGRVPEGPDPADQVATISDALVDLGWTLEREGTDPEPYADLVRDDLRAGVSVSRRLDEPGVTFGITAPCLDVPDDFVLDAERREVDLTP